MELKEYQQGVSTKLERYLTVLAEKHEDAQDFVEFQRTKGKQTVLGDYCREAWDQLNTDQVLPYLSHNGSPVVAPYLSRHDGLGHSILNICFKVPTGGGKTLLATAALERIQTDYFKRQTGLVLWVVPSDAIYRQTWKQLANREHPYRQMLEQASGGRVKLLEKGDAFTQYDVSGQLCVILLMLPSAARKSKETLRLFRDSGRFTSFFPLEDDVAANRTLLDKVPNLDQNDLADLGFADGVLPGSLSIKQSLGNVLRLLQPVVVIDEGHKAYSDTARDTLAGFNPRFILELSATPKHQSNVVVNVPGADLKSEQMIKLPINVINEDKGGWKHTLTLAHAKQEVLEQTALAYQNESGRYIRPIVLIRVERTGNEQRDSGLVHAEDAREYLRDQLGVKEEWIRLKTSSDDDLEKNTAWYLDESQCIYWWHRIAVNQRSYGLQGWQKHRVYPDLLACVHGVENGKFRFTVLETKGDHLKGNDDTEYKRQLFELLTQYADRTSTVGQLDLELPESEIRFQMVMENDWKQTLHTEGI